MAGVVRTQSPSDRKRITAIRAPGGRRCKTVLIFTRSLLFDLSFVDQHHWNVVANRVDAVALNALKTGLIRLQLDRRLAQRTDQDVQQILTNRHGSFPSLTGGGWWVVGGGDGR